MPEYLKRLSPKQCLPKMISYNAHKHPEWSHDKVVAVSASECGVSRKNDIGLDSGIRAALHLAHYKEKYPHLSLQDNLKKAYYKIMQNDMEVDFILENGLEGTFDECLLQIAQDFEEDLIVRDNFNELIAWVEQNIDTDEPESVAYAIMNSRKDKGKEEKDKEKTSEQKQETWKKVWNAIGGEFEKYRKARDKYRAYKEKYDPKQKLISKVEEIRKQREVREKSPKKEILKKVEKLKKKKDFSIPEFQEGGIIKDPHFLALIKEVNENVIPLSKAKDFTKDTEEGRWVTIKGRHVFIKKGQSIEEALNKRSPPKNINEIKELIETLQQQNNYELYVRGSYSESLNKEQSLDLFIQYGYDIPETKEEAEDLMDKYGLWDIADIIDLRKSSHPEAKRMIKEGKTSFAIQYEGVNALDDYDEMMMSHFPYIYIFKGEYLGQNASGDGDIIKPTQVIKKIKNPNYKNDLTTDAVRGPGRPRSRGLKAGTPPALVGGAKTTKTGQALKKAGIPMTVEGPESVTLPFKVINTETGELIEGEMVENLDEGTAQMQPVSSSNVRSAGQAQNELVVAFHSTGEGKFYRFKFATPEMATEARRALQESGSPGRWIWHNIRGHVAGEPVTKTKIGPSLESGRPTIGGTSASLVQYSISKTAPSRVKGYKEAYEKLQRQTSNPATDPSTGARIEGLLGARKGFRELGRKIRQDHVCDFTLTGMLTRSGEFDYTAEGQGVKIKTPDNLKWITEHTEHVPVFGKNGQGAHKESETSLIGFAHNLEYIPPGKVDGYAHIKGDIETFYDIRDLSNLEEPDELPVSFGYDDIGKGKYQKMWRLHHLAVSLDASEKDRCSTMGGPSCNISRKSDMSNSILKPLEKIMVNVKK